MSDPRVPKTGSTGGDATLRAIEWNLACICDRLDAILQAIKAR